MKLTIVRSLLFCSVALGSLSPALSGQSRPANLKLSAPSFSSNGLLGRTLAPTDEALLKFVDEAIQKTVFRGLREVSLATSLEIWPGSDSGAELSEEIKQDITARLERMGLKVVPSDISKQPILAFSLQLIRLPDSARYLAYHLELAVREKVSLRRESPRGEPPARTYRFRAAGYFSKANLGPELKATYNRLLDSLQQALEVSKEAP